MRCVVSCGSTSFPWLVFFFEAPKADPHTCIWEISSNVALSLSTVHKVIHGNLYMRKLAARWIPHKLTEFKKECRDNIATYPFILSEPNGQKRLTNVVMWNETCIFLWHYRRPSECCLARPWRSEIVKQEETTFNLFFSKDLWLWLFLPLKDRLVEIIFSHVQDLSKAVNSDLRSIPLNNYHRAYILCGWLGPSTN